MKIAFADTYFWIALANPGDGAHVLAKKLAMSGAYSQIVTTQEVLTEYLNYFAEWGPYFRASVVTSVLKLPSSPTFLVLAQSVVSFQSGFDLYSARPDKGYSLTDCISMATMRQQGITEALTNDAHFEQEGFRAIFREGR